MDHHLRAQKTTIPSLVGRKMVQETDEATLKALVRELDLEFRSCEYGELGSRIVLVEALSSCSEMTAVKFHPAPHLRPVGNA